MTIRTSNALYLSILDPLPRERLGWWVDVYDAQNPQNLLARFDRVQELTLLDQQSDVGYGSVSLLRDDPVFDDELPNGLPASVLLTRPNYFRVMDNGIERFRWYYEGREQPRELGAIIKLAGPGRAQELTFGIVLSAQYPTQTKAVVRKYVQRTWAYVYLELLAEAQARGAIPTDVTPTFTATTDSVGQPWTDVADYEVPVGTNLLDLIQQYKEAAGFEWHMNHRGELAAATTLGFNRSNQVRFFEGVNVETAQDVEDQSGLRTDVYAQADDGTIVRALSPSAASTYRRRETFLTASGAGNVSAVNLTVNGALKVLSKPLTSRTFKVPMELPDADGVDVRRAFVDYGVSDLIGYGQRLADGSSDYRVVSMAVKIDGDGADLEITVQSKREELIAKLNRLLSRQLGGSFSPSSSSTTLTGVIKQAVNGTVSLADLSDVDVTGATDGQALFWDALAAKWIADDVTGSIDDLTDVDTTTDPPSNGDTLVYDSGSGLWVPGAPGGGGGGNVLDRLWNVPAGWTSFDEFEDETLDPAYVRVDPTGGAARAAWTEEAGVLSVALTGGDAASSMHALVKPLATPLAIGEALVTAQTTLSRGGTGLAVPGIGIADGVTYGAGAQLWATGYLGASYAITCSARAMTNYSVPGTESGSSAVGPVSPLYLRLVRVGTTSWRTDQSPDGVSWWKGPAITSTIAPTHVGFATSSWGQSNPSVTTWWFLRRMSGVT